MYQENYFIESDSSVATHNVLGEYAIKVIDLQGRACTITLKFLIILICFISVRIM